MIYRVTQVDDSESKEICITVDVRVISDIINSWLDEWEDREKA
jgi:hypothetical protein